MADSRPIPLPRRTPGENDRLDSWKEIAAYLGREVRTVQLWEKNEGLPVHRHQHARQGSVYAYKSELDTWREARKTAMPDPVVAAEPAGPASSGPPRVALIAAALSLLVLAGAGFVFWKFRQTRTPAAGLSSVVVLPFVDMSSAKDQDYFSDGLTEELIDALSRVPNLRVVARTSAFAFKGKNADIRQIGQQLNVNAVLEGSVRKDGDKLRITAQLNRVTDGTHLWSRTFDRQLRDIFAVQREISQSIADQLRAGQVPDRAATSDLEAYRLYQEARYFFNQHLAESYPKAIERYQQAIDRDPKFALAYAGLADAYAYMAENFVVAPREVMPKAKAAAEKAVALNDSLGEAHISRGIVKMDYEWDVDGAQREFLRALQINPGSSWGRHWYAHSLEAQKKLPEAMKEMRAALDLDPLSVVVRWDVANELLMTQKPDDALSLLKETNELYPAHPVIQYFLASAYTQKGDLAAVHRIFDAMPREAAEQPEHIALIGSVAAVEGHRTQAVEALAKLEKLRAVRYVEPFFVLDLCMALHDDEKSKLWLKRAHDERSTMFVYLPVVSQGNKVVEDFLAHLH